MFYLHVYLSTTCILMLTGQKRVLDPLQLEFQMVVSRHGLGIKCRSRALNH